MENCASWRFGLTLLFFLNVLLESLLQFCIILCIKYNSIALVILNYDPCKKYMGWRVLRILSSNALSLSCSVSFCAMSLSISFCICLCLCLSVSVSVSHSLSLSLSLFLSLSVIIFYPPASANVFISTSPIGFNLPASLIAFFIFTCILIGRILVIIDRWCRSRVINPSQRIIIICCCLGEYWHLMYFRKQ